MRFKKRETIFISNMFRGVRKKAQISRCSIWTLFLLPTEYLGYKSILELGPLSAKLRGPNPGYWLICRYPGIYWVNARSPGSGSKSFLS